MNPVSGCARCHRDHEDVEFVRLTHPITVGPKTFTHWAPCPTNGEPMLMRYIAGTRLTHAATEPGEQHAAGLL